MKIYLEQNSNIVAGHLTLGKDVAGFLGNTSMSVWGSNNGLFEKTNNFHFIKHSADNPRIAVFKGKIDNRINNQIGTTTNNKFSGRVSFCGGTGQKVIEKIVKSKMFASFCELAQKNSAVAEAVGALFITCGMRPLAIMAMPQKDVDKNRKAASHSIASGVTGFVFAKIAYEPFSAAMKKIQDAIKDGRASEYLGDNATYLLKKGIEKTKNGVKKNISNMDCFNQLVTYGPKVLTASILAAFTVGTMPYIDKYIIDKYILKNRPKPDDKPVFTTYDHFKFITFKSTPSGKEVFQNFKGALK